MTKCYGKGNFLTKQNNFATEINHLKAKLDLDTDIYIHIS